MKTSGAAFAGTQNAVFHCAAGTPGPIPGLDVQARSSVWLR